ncbi:hypothetical protein [uncultured Eudoraea sp.]|uniref:hypothetical protein n=1 Tax=uncultured Eudoraea sp. TaxID=1035614 RepID=UPI00260E2F4F|nr:hypothetical protein [uncultured Eudoraea sp.]
MNNKLNLWLICSFIVAASITVWIYFKLDEQVGDIAFNRKQDLLEFRPCNDDKIFQYYSLNTDYRGGKRAMKQDILQNTQIKNLPKNGLLTIRYVVNCKGDSGYFRAKMIDPELNEIDISNKDLSELYSVLAKLQKWQPGMIQNQMQDSYVQITFKFYKGKIIDIF